MGNIQQSKRFFASISCEDIQQRTAPRRTVTLGVLRLSLPERFICGTGNNCGYLSPKAVEDGEPQDVGGQRLSETNKKKMQVRLKPVEAREHEREKIKKYRAAVDLPASYLNTPPPPQDRLETKSYLLTVL